MALHNLTPRAVADALDEGAILLIDVREPGEYAREHIEGALLFPLTGFDPGALPDPGGKRIVFHCAAGGRSAKAAAICRDAGLPHESHLAGGIKAWKDAGLATVLGN